MGTSTDRITHSAEADASSPLKDQVHDFWEQGSCGEVYLDGDARRAQFEAHAKARYGLEPYIEPFARFEEGAGKDVLEIGVGLGADHLRWARSRPRSLVGVDLTERAVAQTRERFGLEGLPVDARVADAENLPFADESFDIVYSYGVIHHSPGTRRCVEEIHRVLRKGGRARIMIYHTYALVGYMLWLRYALLAGKPRTSLKEIYASHLESPGTQTFTVDEAREMFAGFSDVDVRVQLGFGDLLLGEVGQRHRGRMLSAARRLWPRSFIKRRLSGHGLTLLIEAAK